MGIIIGLTAMHKSANVRVPSVKAVAAPTNPSATGEETGGTLAADTYHYKITAIGEKGGETVGSTEVSDTIAGSTGKITLDWDDMPGAVSYRIYKSDTGAGLQDEYFEATASTFVDDGDPAAGTAGTVPTTNTALGDNGEQLLVPGTVTLVDVDDIDTRQALRHHRSVGQYIVAALNSRYRDGVGTTAAVPANS